MMASFSAVFFLLKVHETPSEESVTLMGKDIEIRIAFKGQAKALKQFRNMLVPAGANTAASGTFWSPYASWQGRNISEQNLAVHYHGG